MEIKIYGPGCMRCKMLEQNARKAVEELKKTATFEKVTDMGKIIEAGIMMTPGLEIDGKVVSTGKVPSPEEIKKYIKK
jgi:small redox-active disulfide protein 2